MEVALEHVSHRGEHLVVLDRRLHVRRLLGLDADGRPATPVYSYADARSAPYALQLNKRDLPQILPVEEMLRQLRVKEEPVVEAVAFQGVGVFDTLKEIARQVLVELKQGG